LASAPLFAQTAPVITGLNPSTAAAGSTSVTLTITGSNFVPGSVVRWSGTPLTTTFVSGTQLTAVAPGTLLTTPGFGLVTVTNPDGFSSPAFPFTVTSSPLSISTTSLPAGSVGVAYSATLTATGGVAP
jgi:hypothetical protein